MDCIFGEGCSTMWTAVGAIAQGVASILAMIALIYSMTTFKKSLMFSNYGELDRMYFEILKIAMEKSAFTNRKPGQVGEQAEYDLYAFMVWNFLETIHDRCETDRRLRLTWDPVMQYEASLHKEWFDQPENASKFKQKFARFVQGGFKQW